MRYFKLGALACALSAGVACSSDDEEGGSGVNGSGDPPGSGTSDPGSGLGGGTFMNPGTSGGSFEECAGDSVAAESVPLDIYIMFDQSCSMSCPPELAGPGQCCLGDPRPRMDQVRSAVKQFIAAPESAGIGVGIGYFGYFPTGETSCDPADYDDASVGIAQLPGNAAALNQSLDSITPVGETPTGAAIRGACTYARGWKNANPAHAVVILLVTDGVPEAPVTQTCQPRPSIEDAEARCQRVRGCADLYSNVRRGRRREPR